MTQQAQAEALRLADLIESGNRRSGDAEIAAELRRLHARVQKQDAELIALDASRADEKLRADQMSQQHDHQAAMNREAREQLAQLEEINWQLSAQYDVAATAYAQLEAQQAVQLPEPVAFALEWTFNGEERGMRLYDDETHCRFDAESDGGVCSPLYTEQQVRAMLSTPPAQERKPAPVVYPADMTSFNARMAFKAGWQSGERAHGIGVDT